MDTLCHTVVSCLVVEDVVLCRAVELVEAEVHLWVAEDLKETSRSSSTNKLEMPVPSHQALPRPLLRPHNRCHLRAPLLPVPLHLLLLRCRRI